MMNKIEFEIEYTSQGQSEVKSPLVLIKIDGTDFKEGLKENHDFEYVNGVHVKEIDRFIPFKNTDYIDDETGRVAIYICPCEEEGCSNIACVISESETEIIWDSFGAVWVEEVEYPEVGPFIFKKSQYLEALEALKLNLTEMK